MTGGETIILLPSMRIFLLILRKEYPSFLPSDHFPSHFPYRYTAAETQFLLKDFSISTF